MIKTTRWRGSIKNSEVARLPVATRNLPLRQISKAGYEKSLNSGIVFTGGAAMLDGMAEIAEQIFDLPVRRSAPEGVGGLADHVNSPAFATSVGVESRPSGIDARN